MQVAYDTFTAAARIFSIESGKAQVEAKNGKFVSTFRGNSGKAYCDTGTLYSTNEVEAVFELVLRPSQSVRGRRKSNGHLLTLQSLSERFPPLLWSLYVMYGKQVSTKTAAMVKSNEERGGA